MNELVNMVVSKTGISEDKARQAVEVVVNYMKGKLPAPVASHLDQFTSGGETAEGGKGVAGAIGAMFKDKAS